MRWARVWLGTGETRGGGLGFDRLGPLCVFSEKRGASDRMVRRFRWSHRVIRGRVILVV
jgi:hypothetical protein